MVQLGGRTRWALDFPLYPKWGSKPMEESLGTVIPAAQPFSTAQGEGLMAMEHRKAAATHRDLAEGTGCVSPGRWWGKGEDEES